ncbi:MAG: alkaline phosphatase family protein [Haloquadratum sp.]|jgi:predicted AlkP superfamily phosphohydrolase/phosphomutase|nr:alkaline phosphatase family protein [Haloferacaceae archaeon]MDR9444605.1 alkaline phosphatase family protein [Haloquadratum sp.]
MGLFDRLRGDSAPRVALIGIDGVPHQLLADNPDVFPTFAAIAEAGSAGPIDSIVPPESSACWPAITTGVNPGKTGVYGFQDREVGSYETYIPMGRDVQTPRIWDRLADAGRRASVLNVPVTFPPQRGIDRMVAGFLSPSLEKAAHPPEFAETLAADGYRIDVNAKLGHDDDKTAFLENASETMEARHRAFMDVLATDDWDLFCGVYMTTDRINHFLFDAYADPTPAYEEFMDVYRRLDGYIAEIWEGLDEDTALIIMSDHGFTRLHHEVHCNVFLEQEGWLSFRDDDHADLADIAPASRAFSFIPGRFYLNLEGREPEGCVAADEYESVRDELRTLLEGMTGPDGEPVADRIVDGEAVFRGDHAGIAPDLVMLPHHGFDLKAGFAGGEEVFTTGPRTGMHAFDNATLYSDVPDLDLAEADILDVAPTIFELMEAEYDRTMFDGVSLLQA